MNTRRSITNAAERRSEAARVAALALGRTTLSRGLAIEKAVVVDGMIRVTFAGSGLAPFREARYTAKEVLSMIGEN